MRGPPGGSGDPLLNPLDATSVLGKGRRLSDSATTRLCELTDRGAATNNQWKSIRAVVRKTLIRLSSNGCSNWHARVSVGLVNFYGNEKTGNSLILFAWQRIEQREESRVFHVQISR